MWKRLTTAIATTLAWGVRGYRLAVSPLLPPSCRFTPTCSTYAIEALERKGLFAGTYLAIRRLLRCHPFHPGGYDPVERPVVPDGPASSGCQGGLKRTIGYERIDVPGGSRRNRVSGGPHDQPHPTA